MQEREKGRHPGLSSFRSLLVDIGLFSIIGVGVGVIITCDFTRGRIEAARDRFISNFFSRGNKL